MNVLGVVIKKFRNVDWMLVIGGVLLMLSTWVILHFFQ